MWLGEKIKIPWKNKVTKNACEHIDLYIQHNPYQKIPATWVKEIDKLILKFVWELKELKRAKQFWKREEPGGRIHTCWFQDLWQSNSNQDSVVSTDTKKGIYINGKEMKVQKYTLTFMVNGFFTKLSWKWEKNRFFNKWC